MLVAKVLPEPVVQPTGPHAAVLTPIAEENSRHSPVFLRSYWPSDIGMTMEKGAYTVIVVEKYLGRK
jgi:hypothetical protein